MWTNFAQPYLWICLKFSLSDSRGSQKEGLNWFGAGKNNKNIRCKSESLNFLSMLKNQRNPFNIMADPYIWS